MEARFGNMAALEYSISKEEILLLNTNMCSVAYYLVTRNSVHIKVCLGTN